MAPAAPVEDPAAAAADSPGGPGGPGGGPGGPGRQFDVAITLPDGDVVTFRTDVPRAGPPLPRQIFVELALVTIVLAAVLYLMARTITRPLADLAIAAEAIGSGAQHEPLVRPARASCVKRRARSTRCRNACTDISTAARVCSQQCPTTCARRSHV